MNDYLGVIDKWVHLLSFETLKEVCPTQSHNVLDVSITLTYINPSF